MRPGCDLSLLAVCVQRLQTRCWVDLHRGHPLPEMLWSRGRPGGRWAAFHRCMTVYCSAPDFALNGYPPTLRHLIKGPRVTTETSSRETIANHLEAMKHPLREKIWLFLFEGGVSTPKQMADALGDTVQNVSHHTKRLAQLGCAELVEERKVRGTVEHRYRAIRPMLVDDDAWRYLVEKWPAFADRKLGDFIQAWIDDCRRSIEAGALGRDDHWMISRIPVLVDEQGRDELLELLLQTDSEEVADIVQRSTKRRALSGDKAIRFSVFLAGIQMPPR